MWQNTWVIFIRSSLLKKKKVWMWQCGYCTGKEKVQYTVPRWFQAFFLFFKFWNDFSFSSQVLRSLNAFWSWGWPGNLRTYTNAPKIQTTGFYFSLFLSQIPQTVFSFWVLVCFQINIDSYSGVLFLASFCIIVIYCTCNELISTVI